MIRALVLVVFGVMILGTSCPGDFCDNGVNSPEFGFALTIPSEFSCTSVFPDSTVLAQGRWYYSAGKLIASVVVQSPSSQAGQGQVENCQAACPDTDANGCYMTEDLGQVTNGNGIAFSLNKVTLVNQDNCQPVFFGYLATAEMPGGNNLSITIGAATDDAALGTTLNTIIESVQWLS